MGDVLNRATSAVDEVVEWFDIPREQVVAILEFAARSMEVPARVA